MRKMLGDMANYIITVWKSGGRVPHLTAPMYALEEVGDASPTQLRPCIHWKGVIQIVNENC